jgi:hypothetical protein
VGLPVLVSNTSQGTKRTISGAPQEIPPFLINKKTDSEND